MKELINPMTREIPKKAKIILTYGISDKQTQLLLKNLPSSNIVITDVSECFTDIIATNYIAVVINPDVLLNAHIDYLNEMCEDFIITNERIVFVKNHPILKELKNRNKYIVFSDDFEYGAKIKYILLDALREEKKMQNYSDTISQTIRVLSEIRRKPYISTAQLAAIIERTPRTVQRYINTLICAGEFLEYDRKKKGWYIFQNKSVLWGDYD